MFEELFDGLIARARQREESPPRRTTTIPRSFAKARVRAQLAQSHRVRADRDRHTARSLGLGSTRRGGRRGGGAALGHASDPARSQYGCRALHTQFSILGAPVAALLGPVEGSAAGRSAAISHVARRLHHLDGGRAGARAGVDPLARLEDGDPPHLVLAVRPSLCGRDDSGRR